MISIVMAYHNRLPQLIKTLESIKAQLPVKSAIEVIIVDENSSKAQSPVQHIKEVKYPFDIRLVTSPKLAENPCMAYNKAFSFIRGDKVIIQNPECIHIGKIIDCVADKLTDDNYLSFSTFSLDKQRTLDLVQLPSFSMEAVSDIYKNSSGRWYNHPKHEPTNYHFCTAITHANLKKLGGFDERYKDGKCFDDNEFITRVKRYGLVVNPVTFPMVIHLWHPKSENVKTPEYLAMWKKNESLFKNVTLKEKTWKLNQ